MQFSDRIGRLSGEGAFEVLARCKLLEKQGKSIIHLEIGEPDFSTPPNIAEAGIKAIRDGHTHYGPSIGLQETRVAVAEFMSKTRNISVGPEHCAVLPGVKPVIFGTVLALINEGDEVIVPDPGYPTYASAVNFVGAKPVPIVLRESNQWRFDVNELRSLITPRTKMIMINSPANPTGGVLTRSDMEAIYELAERHDLWIVTDEIYSQFVYDGKFESIAAIPGAMKRTVIVEGMSKAYAMTGWRMGFGVMPEKLCTYFATLSVNSFSCPTTFSQYAMIEGLRGPQDSVKKMVAEFHKRRDIFAEGLNKIEGVSCLIPHGAFYLFPNIKETGYTSKELANKLLDEVGVACLAGTAFGAAGEGYLRFSYANSIANINEAVNRFSKALSATKV